MSISNGLCKVKPIPIGKTSKDDMGNILKSIWETIFGRKELTLQQHFQKAFEIMEEDYKNWLMEEDLKKWLKQREEENVKAERSKLPVLSGEGLQPLGGAIPIHLPEIAPHPRLIVIESFSSYECRER